MPFAVSVPKSRLGSITKVPKFTNLGPDHPSPPMNKPEITNCLMCLFVIVTKTKSSSITLWHLHWNTVPLLIGMRIITIFGHEHFKQNFIKKIDVFHQKKNVTNQMLQKLYNLISILDYVYTKEIFLQVLPFTIR